MKIQRLITLSVAQKEAIMWLWNNEYPKQLENPDIKSFDGYLKECSNPKHYLVTSESKHLDAWAITFDRDHERWFAIIVNSESQGKGLGTKLLEALKSDHPILNGWVIDHNGDQKPNGEHYISPLPFYLKNGFHEITNERLETELLSAVKIRYPIT